MDSVSKIRESERVEELRQAISICCGMMSLPLYLFFWLADIIYAPEKKWEFLGLRLLIVPVCLTVRYLCSSKQRSLRYLQNLALLFAFCNGILITIMILVTNGASSPYYAGLTLVTLGILSFFPWTTTYLYVTIASIFLPYYVGILSKGISDGEFQSLYLNSFFIAGTVVASLVIRWFREKLKLQEIRTRVALQQAQASLIQSEKLVALGTLSAGIGHEINNSMMRVSSGLEYIENFLSSLPDNSGKENAVTIFEVMKKATGLTIEIVANLRSYSRQEKGAFSNLNILSLVNTVVGLFKSSIGGEIEVELIISEKLEVVGSHAGITQLISNLLGNAIQAIGNKAGKVVISASSNEKSWILSISDTGEGIQQDVIDRIFDAFFTTKPVGQGTGLGLYVVQMEVKKHKGTVSVKSTPGVGTVFSFEFPMLVNHTITN